MTTADSRWTEPRALPGSDPTVSAAHPGARPLVGAFCDRGATHRNLSAAVGVRSATRPAPIGRGNCSGAALRVPRLSFGHRTMPLRRRSRSRSRVVLLILLTRPRSPTRPWRAAGPEGLARSGSREARQPPEGRPARDRRSTASDDAEQRSGGRREIRSPPHGAGPPPARPNTPCRAVDRCSAPGTPRFSRDRKDDHRLLKTSRARGRSALR